MTDLWETPLDEDTHAPGQLTRRRDIDAERALVGAVMVRPALIDELDGTFDPVDFSDQRHAWVWYAVDELRNEIAEGAIAWHAVHQRLLKHRTEGRIPGVPFDEMDLCRLYDEAAPAQADFYAERVADTAVASRLVDLGLQAQQAGLSAAFDPTADLAALQSALDGVLRENARSKASPVGDLLADALERAVTPQEVGDRVPTGYSDLDHLTGGGLRPGRLVIVGARPGVGKTLFGVGLARAAAIKHGLPTLFHSLEMGRDEITDLILAAEATVAQHHLSAGACSDGDATKLLNTAQRITQAPLRIDDNTTLSIPQLRNEIRTLVRTEGLRLVVVDYLQLMQAPKAESRQVAVAAMSRALKLIAKEFGIVLVVLCQLNRASVQRADKRPEISDLRESGAIEQDADMVILLSRPDMHEPESPRAGEADLIVDKHRGGSRATITVAAQPHYSRFVDMAWMPSVVTGDGGIGVRTHEEAA